MLASSSLHVNNPLVCYQQVVSKVLVVVSNGSVAFVPAFQSESLIMIRYVSNALGRVPVDSRLNMVFSESQFLVALFQFFSLISPRLTEINGLTVVALGSSLSLTFPSGLSQSSDRFVSYTDVVGLVGMYCRIRAIVSEVP